MLRMNTAKNTAKKMEPTVMAVLLLFLQMFRQASFINTSCGFEVKGLRIEVRVAITSNLSPDTFYFIFFI